MHISRPYKTLHAVMQYHLVRCRVVEDLIDSPHLSQDCTKYQEVTQHIHPSVQLHGKGHI